MNRIFTLLWFILLSTFLFAQDEQTVVKNREQTVNKNLEAKLDSLFASFNNDAAINAFGLFV